MWSRARVFAGNRKNRIKLLCSIWCSKFRQVLKQFNSFVSILLKIFRVASLFESFFLIPNHVLISAYFFQCKSWNSSWSWNKLPLKNLLSFKNIRHLTLPMSNCVISNNLRAGSFGGFGDGKWGTFSPLPSQPPKETACRLL